MVLAPENKLVDELKDRIKNWDEVEKYCDLEKDFAIYIQGRKYFDENELDAYEKYASHLKNHKILRSIKAIRRNHKAEL